MPAAPKPAFQRILLKLSGESLLGKLSYGIDIKTTQAIAQEIKEVHALGVQIAIMIGGGNIFRGVRGTSEGVERVSADQMGLLATIMNGRAWSPGTCPRSRSRPSPSRSSGGGPSATWKRAGS
jgi:uridylate kinase